jgi:N-acetylmuramoyl-L-alanine amidase
MPKYKSICRHWTVVFLVLIAFGQSSSLVDRYKVRKGDSLWSIAKAFKTSVKEIKSLNGLKSDRVFVGQVLHLAPQAREIQAENGPYYWSRPRADAQKSGGYIERSKSGTLEDYNRAKSLIKGFDDEIRRKLAKKRRGRLPLKGWRIVIDPGHGGVDPGAIVSNKTGANKPVYVVEDEYVYDIALRVYEELRLRGAEVEMTLLSPNHLIRDNLPASATFVHEQNEVYNDKRYNQKKRSAARPRSANLNQRVRIANQFYKGGKKRRTLFLSIHADNSPGRPKGPLALYLKRNGKIDKPSRTFAQLMQKALDGPNLKAQIKGRSLGVLRGNKANAEILVEIRNVHDVGEAYLLRFHEKRQRDAERIAEGILKYANR